MNCGLEQGPCQSIITVTKPPPGGVIALAVSVLYIKKERCTSMLLTQFEIPTHYLEIQTQTERNTSTLLRQRERQEHITLIEKYEHITQRETLIHYSDRDYSERNTNT